MPTLLQPQCLWKGEMHSLLWIDVNDLKSPDSGTVQVPSCNIGSTHGTSSIRKVIESKRRDFQYLLRRDDVVGGTPWPKQPRIWFAKERLHFRVDLSFCHHSASRWVRVVPPEENS